MYKIEIYNANFTMQFCAIHLTKSRDFGLGLCKKSLNFIRDRFHLTKVAPTYQFINWELPISRYWTSPEKNCYLSKKRKTKSSQFRFNEEIETTKPDPDLAHQPNSLSRNDDIVRLMGMFNVPIVVA